MNYFIMSIPFIFKICVFLYSRRNIIDITKKIIFENLVYLILCTVYLLLNWNLLKFEFLPNKINIGNIFLTLWIFCYFFTFCISLVSMVYSEVFSIDVVKNLKNYDLCENIFFLELFIYYKSLYFENDLAILVLMILIKFLLNFLDVLWFSEKTFYNAVVSTISCLFTILFYVATYNFVWAAVFLVLALFIINYKEYRKRMV